MRFALPAAFDLLLVGVTAAAAAAQQGQSVVDTPHNLSVSGPGVVRAATEEQVCIFCHTPHNASPIQPLWNRYMPVNAYIVYSSNALDAEPGQPTGASKMCLSCHDGTIALGSVISQGQTIQMGGGITTLPPGASNLGTDLSDDHPISFRYGSSLVVKDPHLVDPSQLPPALHLDANGELQCTTCHQPHDDTFGHFLVMSNDNSTLCRACHQISTTTVPSHRDCNVCHRAHTAPSGPYLLTGDRISSTCLTCHDGSHPRALNIASDLSKFDVHDTNSPVDPPNPIPQHVTCADCHNPHTMDRGAGRAPNVHPNFGRVSGVSAAGSPIEVANYEYEVCYKCHADENALTAPRVSRQITEINTRLEFALSSISFHPVEGPGRNRDVPSLKPRWTTESLVYCSDCHGSDTGRQAGGSGPNGVHGSNEEPLLVARYETSDHTPESASAYALCYQCHYRHIILDEVGPLRDVHRLHIQDENTPCSACHDPHGISSAQGSMLNNSHLINFDSSIVFADPRTGRLEYRGLGTFRGECFLSCHGVTHSPATYDDRAGPALNTRSIRP
jgi:predicted CXXCH cytochrome family protein